MGFKKIDPQFNFAPERSSGPTGQDDLVLKDFIRLNKFFTAVLLEINFLPVLQSTGRFPVARISMSASVSIPVFQK